MAVMYSRRLGEAELYRLSANGVSRSRPRSHVRRALRTLGGGLLKQWNKYAYFLLSWRGGS